MTKSLEKELASCLHLIQQLPIGVTIYDTTASNHVLKPCALRITWWNWLS